MGKGYKLTSATGDVPKQCAFYFSDKGCRNGANCKFSHEAVTQKHSSPSSPPSLSSSSAVSSESESEGEIVEDRAGAYASLAKLADEAKQHLAASSSGATGRPNDVAVSNAAVAAAPSGFSSNNPFLAVPPATPNAPHAATSTTPAKAAEAAAATPQPQQQQQSEKKKKKRKKSLTPGENVFDLGSPSNPPGNATTAVTDLKSLVAPPPPKTAAKEPIATPVPPPAKKSKTTNTKSTPTPGVPSFRDLQLPTTSFSLPTPAAVTTATPSTATPTPRPPSPQHEPAHLPPPPPLPTATPQHRLWTKAVVSTRSHPNHSNSYSFPPSTTPGWISPRPHGPWCASIPAAIAIDCEMCETRDPLTQTLNPKALCRLSIVNADRPSEILIDTLVKPEWPVSNHRTWVNGIGSQDLEHVQFTLQHAQQFMMALCSDQTVIVGHAVHNDLKALRMIHHCVVDTAMLFAHAGEEEGSTPSLKNVAYGVLKGREMPEVHDSVNDARVSLECALFWRERDGVVEPVEKVFSRNAGSRGYKSVDPNETATLLVHRLPRTTEVAHIEEMFLAFTFVKPKLVKEIAFSGTHGKCYVEFASADHANLAYDTLLGEEREDKTGKKQKRVGLKGGGYVCVRKMRKGK
mmetsp:Transcript_19004/g.39496  ORF Transcript_19004/g.39496 Transcript_19004/m.39496 type:complete len:631 (-) Transcript_19004:178-2070(-)